MATGVASLCAGALVFTVFGWPIGWYTTIAMSLALVGPVVLAAVALKSRRYCLAPILVAAYCLVPYESYTIHDLRTGREGVEIHPRLWLGHAGPNTDLISEHLGQRRSEWTYRGTRSLFFGLGDWRDGFDLVNAQNLVFQPYLPDVLAKLPDDDGRALVLECLSSEENLLRVHQGFLLTCLVELDYPPGYDAASWWTKHASLFRIERDADNAVRTVLGWEGEVNAFVEASTKKSIQMQWWAARLQQGEGVLGGDREFQHRFLRPSLSDYEAYEANSVVWWPASTWAALQD